MRASRPRSVARRRGSYLCAGDLGFRCADGGTSSGLRHWDVGRVLTTNELNYVDLCVGFGNIMIGIVDWVGTGISLLVTVVLVM